MVLVENWEASWNGCSLGQQNLELSFCWLDLPFPCNWSLRYDVAALAVDKTFGWSLRHSCLDDGCLRRVSEEHGNKRGWESV